MAGFYVAYATSGMPRPRLEPEKGGDPGNPYKAVKGCRECGCELWIQPAHAIGLKLICWDCYKAATLAWAQ